MLFNNLSIIVSCSIRKISFFSSINSFSFKSLIIFLGHFKDNKSCKLNVLLSKTMTVNQYNYSVDNVSIISSFWGNEYLFFIIISLISFMLPSHSDSNKFNTSFLEM